MTAAQTGLRAVSQLCWHQTTQSTAISRIPWAAGAGLCDQEAVRFVVENGREAIEELIRLGVAFSRYDDQPEEGYDFHLTREGGHSRRRVIHAADATGKAVQSTLNDRVRAEKNIDLFTDFIAIDVITNRHLDPNDRPDVNQAYGVYALNKRTGRVDAFYGRSTILATGGASRVYLYSSNPDGSTGDGIALAWRAGCRVANMEFNQFHPTVLFHPGVKTFLVTEAMRGEGAVLRLENGDRFMDRYHDKAELAPRDVVARAIDAEMKRTGEPCVWLDITHRDPDFILSHFPNIYRTCMNVGIDITRDRIPVVPAAHYTCGGIVTDTAGSTDLPGLYAIGECAHTGLHGANRMASNSLLECLVYGRSAAEDIASRFDTLAEPVFARKWDDTKVTDSDEEVVVSHNWAELRRFMWDYVGIVRTDKRLQRAKRRVDLLMGEIMDYYGNFRVTADLLELRNLVTVADLIVRSAMQRKESRGLHYTTDYPDPAEDSRTTILTPFGDTLRKNLD